MQFLPYERVSFRSAASAGEILGRLNSLVEPMTWFRNPSGHKPYRGEVTANTFSIERVIRYRNTGIPTLVGTVRDDGSGAVIEATLSLKPVVLVFVVLWFGFIGLGAVASLGSSQGMEFFFGGMLLLGYLALQGGFLFEAKKAKGFLEKLAASPPAPKELPVTAR